MSALWLDIEVYADHEEELQALFTELVEEGADDELPPIIQDGGLEWDTCGRKRHVLVDTTDLLLKVVVHPSNVHDRKGGELVLADIKQQLPRLTHIWAD